jgi:hypothetical protein
METDVVAVDDEDDEPIPRSEVIALLAKATGKSIGEIIKEDWNRAKHEEFWTDPCWSTP